MKDQYCIDVHVKRPFRAGQIVFVPARIAAVFEDGTMVLAPAVPPPAGDPLRIPMSVAYGIIGEVE